MIAETYKIDVTGRRNTKKIRLEIYKAALDYLKNHRFNFNHGFCSLFKRIIENKRLEVPENFYTYNDCKLYPEIHAYMPKNFSFWYWFPEYDQEPRIKILKKVIKKMEGNK